MSILTQTPQLCNLFDLASHDTTLKKAADTNGGEWVGPCPFCGGKDRFHVWPNEEKPRFWCRQCDKKGDVIDYLKERDGLTFIGALRALGGDVGAHSAPPPSQPGPDRAKWTDAAIDFIETSLIHLRGAEGVKARAYLHNRGLNDETLNEWNIGYNPKDYEDPRKWGDKVFIPRGIVIPNQDETGLHYIKIRKPVGEPKYIMVTGSKGWLYGGMSCKGHSECFLFEGEFDCLLAWQTGLSVGCCSIPAGQDLKPEYSRYFQDTEKLIIAFDNDEPGLKGAEKIYSQSHEYFYKADPLPQGKDLTEFAQRGGDVLDWLLQEINKSYGIPL
jgi:DNA primase